MIKPTLGALVLLFKILLIFLILRFYSFNQGGKKIVFKNDNVDQEIPSPHND
jgi:hypothetical protein